MRRISVPTYSYACTQCDNRFDIVQTFSDDTLTVCPECFGKLRKLFNSVGIVFKGSGFYRTDSRGGSSTASEPAKTESAPAAKTETTKSGSTSTSTPAPAKQAVAS